MTGLGKPKVITKLEVISSAVAEILKGTPKVWGTPQAQGNTHFLFWCDLIWDLANPNQIQKTPSLFSCSDDINP